MTDTQVELERRLADSIQEGFESQHIPFLEKLVNQSSYTDVPEDVEAVAVMIDELVDQLGLSRELFPDPEKRYANHRVYSTAATGSDDRALALIGHCDTVYPRELGFLEFKRDQSAKAYGPGVLDMKSGLTVILFALRAVCQQAPEIWKDCKLRFILNTEEEVGSPSSESLFKAMAPKISHAMVFEGGRDGDQIVTSRKGTGGFKIKAIGSSAHSGNDHADGVNAIHVLALLIPQLEALTDYDAGTTVNVGVIQGGTAKNTVPGEAECLVDVRVSRVDEMHKIESSLQRIVNWQFPGVESVPAKIQTARVELSGGMTRPPMESTEASEKLRENYEHFARRAGLGGGMAPMQGGGSDANNLAALGIPTIDGLGPFGKFMHHPKEWCCLKSLQKRTLALAWYLAIGNR